MANHASGTREKRKLLIVEDDDELRSLLGDHFHRLGYQVETAADGNEGIAQALLLRPDVIVVDLMMPRLDGWGLAKTLRAYPSTYRTPLVAWTGVGLARERAVSAGFDAVVNKPCSPDEVERVVRALLDGRRPWIDPEEGSVA
jgi:CheY-like chemotaxis protein